MSFFFFIKMETRRKLIKFSIYLDQ